MQLSSLVVYADLFSPERDSAAAAGSLWLRRTTGLPVSQLAGIQDRDKDKVLFDIVLPMVTKDNGIQNYRCWVTAPETDATAGQQSKMQNLDEEVEIDRTQFVLRRLEEWPKDKCFEYFEGNWKYEFCYRSHMRQYYQANINAKPQLEYFLGYSYVHDSASSELWHSKKEKLAFPSLSSSRLVAKRDGSRYLKQVWGGGTVCDVTGKSRTVEIQFHCCDREHISSIQEYTYCMYVVKMHTPKICGIEDFYSQTSGKRQGKTNDDNNNNNNSLQIICEPIIPDDDAEDLEWWSFQQEESATAGEEAASFLSSSSASVTAIQTSFSTNNRLMSILDLARFKCVSPVLCDVNENEDNQPQTFVSSSSSASSSSTSQEFIVTDEKGKAFQVSFVLPPEDTSAAAAAAAQQDDKDTEKEGGKEAA